MVASFVPNDQTGEKNGVHYDSPMTSRFNLKLINDTTVG